MATTTRRRTQPTGTFQRLVGWAQAYSKDTPRRRAQSPNGERTRARRGRIECSWCGRSFSEPAAFNSHTCMRSKAQQKRNSAATNGNGHKPKQASKQQGPFVAPAAGSGRAATRASTRKGGAAVAVDVTAAQDNNDAILKQLNKASGAMSELDLSHAHLFDGTTQQLGQSLLLIADAIREVAEQVDSIPLARQLTRQYEELAEHVAEANDRTKSIRKRFRDEYDEQLNPDKRTPPAGFFHA